MTLKLKDTSMDEISLLLGDLIDIEETSNTRRYLPRTLEIIIVIKLSLKLSSGTTDALDSLLSGYITEEEFHVIIDKKINEIQTEENIMYNAEPIIWNQAL